MNCRTRHRRAVGYVNLVVTAVVALLLISCADAFDQLTDPSASFTDARPSSVEARIPGAADLTAPGRIPGQYIVIFSDDVSDPRGLARALTQQHGGTLHHTYSAAIRGFSANFPEQAIAALAQTPRVKLIERDQVVLTTDVQTAPAWGLDRVDQSNLPLDARYNYAGTGAGVHAYIIDSGIRSSHAEFVGRIGSGFSFINDGNGTEDCMGHGTHVAGTVGGSTVGVAKGVTLHGVRVFGCSGGTPMSVIIAAVDWVTANHTKPAVVNMSLGGGISYALNGAVQNSIAAGVTYVVAAGNSATNACYYSPASTPEAITVAASTADDTHAPFSNFGDCVDLYAPGTYILSSWFTGDSETRVASGTSMASPHVAGAAAVYIGLNPSASPAAVAAAVRGSATSGKVSPRMSATNNSLLNTTALAVYSPEIPSGGKTPGGGSTSNGKGKGRK